MTEPAKQAVLKELVSVFNLTKYPLPPEGHASHKAHVLSLYRRCLKIRQWHRRFFRRFRRRYDKDNRRLRWHKVRYMFRINKHLTDPNQIARAIDQAYNYLHTNPTRTLHHRRHGVNGPLYQRNKEVPEHLQDPNAMVDFERLNEWESESDFYINRRSEGNLITTKIDPLFSPDPKL